MTTMLLPAGSALPAENDNSYRAVAISVDLLPPEIVNARRDRRARRLVLSVLVLFLMLLSGWYAYAHYETAVARAELANAEAEEQRLIQRQDDFAELVRTRSEVQTINNQIVALLADDLEWARLLAAVRTAAPSAVTVTSVTGGLAERDAAASVTEGSVLPNASGAELIGGLTIAGSGATKAAVAAYVDALGSVPGVGNPLLNDVRQVGESGSGVEFTVQVDITSAALGGRYTADAGRGN